MNIHEALAFLLDQIKTNHFLTGATLTGALAGVLYFLRDKIYRLYGAIKRFFKVSIVLHSEDPLYIPVSSWLYAHNFDKLARNYRIRYVDGKATFGPAEGTFLFMYKGKLLRVSIAKDAAQQGISSWRAQTREYLTLSYYSLKRSKTVIEEILKESVADYYCSDEGVPVYVHSQSWSLVTRIAKRKRPAVVLAGDALERIEEDIQTFLQRGEWYFDRGVPFHRGYLLTGPPGTGKTSLVRHLAQKLSLPVYVSDGSIRSITSVPPKSILLMEDVDSIAKIRDAAKAIRGTANVDSASVSSAPDTSKQIEENLFAPTLSELLNALDGVASTDEVIVIMTTNHPEKLDPAIVRPGRVDYRLHLDRCTVEQAVKMFRKFFGENLVADFEAVIEHHAYTPAQLQELFITSPTPQDVIHAVALGLVQERKAA